ncbi:MAG: M28 family peptidase [Edaphobacter sp.]|uniref:M28 family peptidase n=1 Tax=Edaphobacter sp. TaxID=1934404 RepID=UPI00238A76A6|nr:M28 family peptidase [Edaphobacter sp.]MDE1176833.1 M28 family peptidase [Edaphobacter sp.]
MNVFRFITVSSFFASALLSAQSIPPAVKSAESTVDGEKIRAHVKFLSDDLLEGRGPGTRGGEIAAQYIATQFALDGLKPAGDNGTYLQMVNFVGTKTIADKTHLSFVPDKPKGGGMNIMLHSYDLKFGDDYTVNNRRLTESVDINAPIVFVGYGVTAPEYGWDDYAGIDVKDKVVLCIVGDPPSDDPKFFGGKALTYYGRWTYKFEEAARHGAIGALIIHRTDLASYGWDVVRNSNTSEKTYLRDNKDPQLAAASWITLESARTLLHAANLDLETEMTAAGKKGFKAMPLPVSLEAHIEARVRSFQSPNVVAMIPGANVAAGKPDQAVMYTAHYDHLGIVPGKPGDNIYNGAADNATGVGMLLEMARVWSTMKTPPPHSVLFASVAAEEQGLLGSEYLGQHPPVPAGQIALDINYDMILPIGVPLEVNLNGEQRSSFHATVLDTARRFHLTVVPDAHPEAGGYYRSDHFSLSRVGIPAFSVDQGELFEGHDREWGAAKDKAFVDNDYHNFSDNYHADWDFKGNAKLVAFGIDLGWQAIASPKQIEWLPGDEFEAARKASEK